MIKDPKNRWLYSYSGGTSGPYINLTRRVYRLIMRNTMGTIESILIKKTGRLQFAPIFIVGVPRSGTTLLYQLMANTFKVFYFNNLMRFFYQCPVLTSLLTSKIIGDNSHKSFDSYYGSTSGWNSPYQGEGVWFRWFPREPCYVGSGILSSKQKQQLRNTISSMTQIFCVPFINKWPVNSVRILPLSEAFPEAAFIRVRRDPAMAAQSILNGRKEWWGGVDKWLSAMPSNYEDIKSKSYINQVCEQVYYLEEDMDRDSKKVGVERFLDIEYRELCNSPSNIIKKIRRFYQSYRYGTKLEIKGNVPDKFVYDKKILVGKDEFEAIEKCLNRLYNPTRIHRRE